MKRFVGVGCAALLLAATMAGCSALNEPSGGALRDGQPVIVFADCDGFTAVAKLTVYETTEDDDFYYPDYAHAVREVSLDQGSSGSPIVPIQQSGGGYTVTVSTQLPELNPQSTYYVESVAADGTRLEGPYFKPIDLREGRVYSEFFDDYEPISEWVSSCIIDLAIIGLVILGIFALGMLVSLVVIVRDVRRRRRGRRAARAAGTL